MSSAIRALTKTVKHPDGFLHFRAKGAFPQIFPAMVREPSFAALHCQ
jgi:hypothetical protein